MSRLTPLVFVRKELPFKFGVFAAHMRKWGCIVPVCYNPMAWDHYEDLIPDIGDAHERAQWKDMYFTLITLAKEAQKEKDITRPIILHYQWPKTHIGRTFWLQIRFQYLPEHQHVYLTCDWDQCKKRLQKLS